MPVHHAVAFARESAGGFGVRTEGAWFSNTSRTLSPDQTSSRSKFALPANTSAVPLFFRYYPGSETVPSGSPREWIAVCAQPLERSRATSATTRGATRIFLSLLLKVSE